MAVISRAPLPRVRRLPSGLTRFSRELAAMLILFAVYKFGRLLHTSDISVAYENADKVWELERLFNIPSELSAQQALLSLDWLVEFVNVYYAAVHLPATGAFLIWLYFRRPALYPPVRRAIIAMTAIALVAHIVFPLAPPRLMPHLGFVDTGAIYGPLNVYSDNPDQTSLVNQYAAMPSLHVGWAMLVAAGLIAAFSSPWRWLWLLHPTITAIAVVVTANHYWVDSIAAAILLTGITLMLGRYSSPHRRARRACRQVAQASPAPVHLPFAPAIAAEPDLPRLTLLDASLPTEFVAQKA
ncbi:MAG: phosphatase PAP2 family protein [Sporichthyaceae bacterium]